MHDSASPLRAVSPISPGYDHALNWTDSLGTLTGPSSLSFSYHPFWVLDSDLTFSPEVRVVVLVVWQRDYMHTFSSVGPRARDVH